MMYKSVIESIPTYVLEVWVGLVLIFIATAQRRLMRLKESSNEYIRYVKQ